MWKGIPWLGHAIRTSPDRIVFMILNVLKLNKGSSNQNCQTAVLADGLVRSHKPISIDSTKRKAILLQVVRWFLL